MKNNQHKIQIGQTYKVYGTHHVKVVDITNTHIEVVHAVNGSTPHRQCDRFFPLRYADRFVAY
jgi:hypothetical protein